MNLSEQIKNPRIQNGLVFLLFTAIAFFAYRNTFDIFIPSDNYYIFYLFDKYGLEGLKESFRITDIYLVSTNVLFFFFKLFGISSFCWIALSVAFHVFNSFLVYWVCSCVQKLFLSRHNKWFSFFSGLLFLISPYQTETVLWEPTVFKLLVSAFFLLFASYFLFQYFISAKSFHLLWLHVFFLLAIFSYESSLFFPGICLLAFSFLWKKNKNIISFKSFLLKILFPQAGFIFIYFLLCKLWYGHWIWHGGEPLDITVSPFIYTGNFLKYLAKFSLLYRYLHLEYIDVLLRQYYANPFFVPLLFLSLGAVSALIIYLTKKRKESILLGFVFLCFFVSLIPVLHLDSSFLKYIYPDRYGYLPSAFFYMFYSGCIFFVFRKFALPLLCSITILFWLLLAQTISVWNDVNDYCNRIIQNYQPFLKYDPVYVLNIPSYYKGIAAFRSDFPQTIYFHHDKTLIAKIHVIAGSYVETPADSLLSVRIKNDTIEVIGRQKKKPFFSYYGSWAYSYETDDYKVVFDSSGCSYFLQFKKKIPENSAFIYTSNGSWKKVE